MLQNLKEININCIDSFKIGNAQDEKGGTGCTVILCESGAVTGVDVRGGGPASRETDRLDPLCGLDYNHAVILSGGSAYGLDAAGGVMQYLEEKGVGFETGFGIVPLVSGSSLFDLVVGDNKCRPDKQMGYDACLNAETNNYQDGNYGAGTGATVGKLAGPGQMMKSGIGSFAVQLGDVKCGAIIAVNALGDVFDIESGKPLAGLLNPELNMFLNTSTVMTMSIEEKQDFYNSKNTNTTIGCVLTNAVMTNAQAKKLASHAQNGLARVIDPIHTSADGDTVYSMNTCEIEVDPDILGTLVAHVVSKAINNAVLNAQSAYGLKCAKDLLK